MDSISGFGGQSYEWPGGRVNFEYSRGRPMPDSDHSAFSSSSPVSRLARLSSKAWVIAALALGCTPQIGDKCTVSTNCSATGDRLCDITQPGGYCTQFNCEPGSCPDDSVCVNFGTELSPVEGCTPSQFNSPYKRSFCMANCSSDSDCRDGYACLKPRSGDAKEDGDFQAVLAEHDKSGQKVCAVRPHAPPPDGTPNQVCIGTDAGPEAGGSSGGGSGGGGGTAEGGTAGEGGAVSDGGSGG